MSEAKRKRKRLIAAIVILLVIAWLCRISRSGNVKGWIRCTIQCGLLAAWAISVQKRIINEKVRRYLTLIATLFIFWTVEVMVKYTILPPYPTLTRYAWYLYYIPMTLAPVLTLFSALYVGKPEGYKIASRWNLLLIPAFACMILMLTNDLHQFSFSFPDGIPNAGDDYTQGVGFYITMGIVLLEAIAFFAVLLKKCRLAEKGKRVILPFVPILCLLVYATIYVIDYDLIAVVAGDMKSVNVYAIVLTLELCIYKGLLPSNTHYAELLTASDLPAVITNGALTPVFSSKAPVNADNAVLRQAAEGGYVTKQGIRTSAYPVNGGYVFWQEDITELMQVTEKLADLRNELQEQYAVSQDAYKTSYRRQILVEKNRLYNMMQNETADKVQALYRLIEQLEGTEDEAELRRLTAESAVLCAYLKRRNNLLFIHEGSDAVSGTELVYSIRESLASLGLCGVAADAQLVLSRPLSFENITRLYDAFETAVEKTLHNARELFVTLKEEGDVVALRLAFVCAADLYPLADAGFTVTKEEDEEWALKYSVAEGGAAK